MIIRGIVISAGSHTKKNLIYNYTACVPVIQLGPQDTHKAQTLIVAIYNCLLHTPLLVLEGEMGFLD